MSVDSKEVKLFVSSDGTVAGTKTELECQLGVSYSTGIGYSRTVAKNCVHSNRTDAGASMAGSFLEERPMGTAQALLWAAHDGNAPIYAWREDTNAGGLSFHGLWKVAITEIPGAVEGTETHSFTLSAEGTPTRGVTS